MRVSYGLGESRPELRIRIPSFSILEAGNGITECLHTALIYVVEHTDSEQEHVLLRILVRTTCSGQNTITIRVWVRKNCLVTY